MCWSEDPNSVAMFDDFRSVVPIYAWLAICWSAVPISAAWIGICGSLVPISAAWLAICGSLVPISGCLV